MQNQYYMITLIYILSIIIVRKELKKEYKELPPPDNISYILDYIWSIIPIVNLSIINYEKK